MKNEKYVLKLAERIWNFHKINQKVTKADCMIVLGSYDKRVAKSAAKLYLKGYSPIVIFTGKFGRHTKDVFKKTEAETFAHVGIKNGINKEQILLEKQATNTGENFKFSISLLKRKNISPKSFIVVTKPYMERRAYATFKKQYPKVKFIVTSPQMTFQEYVERASEKLKLRHIGAIVGDLLRIKDYPKKGFSIAQRIPKTVLVAANELKKLGYFR